MVNDIGSVRSVIEVTKAEPSQTEPRLRRALTITGLMNIISGFIGVIGGVNYSISSGMVLDTKNASRYPLLVAGAVMESADSAPFTFDNGVVIGFALLITAAVQSIPSVVRPVISNGFVGGNYCGDGA